MNYIIIFGAKFLVALIVLIAGGYFFSISKQQKREMVIFSLITLPIIFIISRLASKLYFNPRPFVVENFLPLISHAADNGFPSDHTLLSAAVASIIFVFNKKIGILLGLLAVLVGMARVTAGVHHYIDIFGSILIVTVVVFLTRRFLKKI